MGGFFMPRVLAFLPKAIRIFFFHTGFADGFVIYVKKVVHIAAKASGPV